MNTTATTTTPTTSVLGSLRQVAPGRKLTFAEALRVAELQACKLLARLDAGDNYIDETGLAELPRVMVVYEDLPVSGTSHWNGRTWVIALNSRESRVRQRFTLLHEFKHIVDHGRVNQLYTGDRRRTSQEQAESAADYFAGCALMPKRLLKRAWGDGLQRPMALARHFGVSVAAIEVRLAQTGLSLPRDRCARPIPSFGHTQRFRTHSSRRSYA